MKVIKRFTWRDVRPGANPRVQLEVDTKELINLRGALERYIEFRQGEEARALDAGMSTGTMQVLAEFTQEGRDMLALLVGEYDALWAGVEDFKGEEEAIEEV